MKKIFFITIATLPIITFAKINNFDDLLNLFFEYAEQIIFLISLLILLAFLWGVADFIRKTGKGEEIAEAKQRLFWGVIALFVAFSLWGIVSFLASDIFGPTKVDVAPQITEDKIFEYFPRNSTQK